MIVDLRGGIWFSSWDKGIKSKLYFTHGALIFHNYMYIKKWDFWPAITQTLMFKLNSG